MDELKPLWPVNGSRRHVVVRDTVIVVDVNVKKTVLRGQAIETYAQGWALARMPAVDRAIARVATWEIVWNDDVDAPVAVDEAITLARMLSTDDSPRYLSGLLGRIGDLADTLR